MMGPARSGACGALVYARPHPETITCTDLRVRASLAGLRQCRAHSDTVARLDLGSHVSGGSSARSVRPLSPFDRRSVQVMVSRPLGRLRRPRLRPATPRHHHLPQPPGLCVACGLHQCRAYPATVVRLGLGSHVSGGLPARSVRPLSPFDRRSVQVMVSRPLGRLRRPRFTPGHAPTPSPAPTSGSVRRSRLRQCRGTSRTGIP